MSFIIEMIEEPPPLPKLTLRDLDFKQDPARPLPKNGSLPKLYTVAESLQNAYIYKNLKPELGSLHQFMDSGLIYKHEQKKKKYEKPEEPEEKRIKTFMQLRKKDPEEVLKNRESTLVERKVAAKMLLDSIFTKEFGQDPDQFYANNIKQKSEAQIFKSIDKSVDRQTGITPTLQQILDDFDNSTAVKQVTQANHIQDKQNNDDANKEFQPKFKRRIIYNQEKVKAELQKHKSKFKSLSKIKTFPLNSEQSQTITKRIQQLKKYQNTSEFLEANRYEGDCRKAKSICLPTSIQHKESFIVDDELFILRKLTISAQQFLWLVTHRVSFENIRVLHLSDTSISEDTMCFFLQMLSRYALYIEEITLVRVNVSPKVVETLRNVIGDLFHLKVFCINECGIDTKAFCLLCLGVGQSASIECFQANKNQIDNRAIKSLQIVIRYIRNLVYIDLRGNKIPEGDAKTLKLMSGFLQKYRNKTVFLEKVE